MTNSIKVFAPATVANVASAFDILGFAIDGPGDEVIVSKNNSSRLVISGISGDNGRLSLDPKINTVSVSIQHFLTHMGINQGFDIFLNKKMPLGSGLGSSSASAVAGVYAVNELLDCPIPKVELLPFAMEGEKVACGTAHADNVAPCLLGGVTLISSYHPLLVRTIPFPIDLKAVIVHPHFEVKTKDSRAVLPVTISLSEATSQWGRIGGLISGLILADYDLISNGLIDYIVEPRRSKLIPGFDLVKEFAMKSGALGCSLSGSGPSIFALVAPDTDPFQIGGAMKEAFSRSGLDSDIYVSGINSEGAQILG